MNSAFLQAEHAGLNRIGIAFPSQESQSRHVRIGIREEHVSSLCGVPSRAGAILLCAGDCYNVTNVGTYARFGAWEASVAFPVQTAVHAVCWNVPSFTRHGIVRRGPRRVPHPTEGRVGVFRWSDLPTSSQLQMLPILRRRSLISLFMRGSRYFLAFVLPPRRRSAARRNATGSLVTIAVIAWYRQPGTT
jgi:hypothetical protein